MPTFTAGQKVRASELNSVPFGHAGLATGFVTTAVTNGIYPGLAAQAVKNGMTFTGNGLRVPEAGLYQIVVRAYYSGGNTGVCEALPVVNSTTLPPPSTGTARPIGNALIAKTTGDDLTSSLVGHAQLAAGDTVRLWMRTAVASTWGTTGYDGTFLEVRFVCP